MTRVRRVPGVARDALLRQISRVRPYQPMRGEPERLEREYAAGVWDYLAADRELPRFSVVAGYCQHFAGAGAILEIGAGEGLLADRLDASRYEEFVGVELSPTAVRRANARGRPRATFVAADATEYEPERDFQAIVFNEVLEYFPDPVAVVRRYERWLAPGGVFVVSQYVGADTARTHRIWRWLGRRYATAATVEVRVARRRRWIVRVLRPAA